jgi:hypothetical protein
LPLKTRCYFFLIPCIQFAFVLANEYIAPVLLPQTKKVLLHFKALIL